jgi:lambda family phage portal protein
MTFSAMMRMSVSQDLMHGEFFCAKEWRTSDYGMKTCFSIIDPMRVTSDTGKDITNGIERDSYGAPVAYHVRSSSKSDPVSSSQRIPRYNRYGWMQLIHVYDAQRPGQSRGISRLASAIRTLKQLDRYNETELEKAILAASYALYIKSDLPDIDKIFSGAGLTPEYQEMLRARNAHREKNPIMNNGATIMNLMPGEEIGALNIQNPTSSYDGFVTSLIRLISRSTGCSYALLSGDYSKTSFASGKLERGDEERFIATKRESFVSKAATLMFRIWLDEAVDKGIVTPPVEYGPNREALTRCGWVATGKTHIDDLKTARARTENLRNGIGTLDQYAREDGADYEDIFQQRVEEGKMKLRAIEEFGIQLPDIERARIIFGELNGSPIDAVNISEMDDTDAA